MYIADRWPPQHLAIYTSDWAQRLAIDVEAATLTLNLCALSFLAPTARQTGTWPRLYKTLVDAAARNVRVQIFLPTPHFAHPATLRNKSTAADLAARNIETRFVPHPNLLHAKACVIDARLLWIGSGNLTQAAATHNHEIYMRADAPELALQVQHWLTGLA